MQIFTIILLILNLFGTIFLYLQPSHSTVFNYLYNFSYGLNFIVAACLCFYYLKSNYNHRSSLLFLGTGFLSFSIAQIVWIYYNIILLTEIPYPGPADFFWILFYPLIAVGLILLLKELRATFNWKNLVEVTIISGLIFMIISSFLSLNNTQDGLPLLTKILNYSYPLWDAILVAVCIIIIRSQVGRTNPHLLYYIFGFVILVAGDTIFAYQTTLETYWNGNITDFIYAFAGFLLLLGTINLPKLLIPQITSKEVSS